MCSGTSRSGTSRPSANPVVATSRHPASVCAHGVLFALLVGTLAGATNFRAIGAQQPADTTAHSGTGSPRTPTGEREATRAQLQAQAAGSGAAAESARDRLANGDFQVGDRIAMAVEGEPTLTDTAVVRAGQVLHLKNIPDIQLHGVLRSELHDRLTQELSRYLRNPVVRATPLVRIAVLGQVSRPGFYVAPADELLSDVVMEAGGPTTQADMNKTTVLRGSRTVWPAGQVLAAMERGETIDQFDVRAGDQIVVGEKPAEGKALRVIGIVSGLLGIAVAVVLITRHH